MNFIHIFRCLQKCVRHCERVCFLTFISQIRIIERQFIMSRQMNGVVNRDTVNDTTEQKTSSMLEPNEIRPSSRDNMSSSAQMTSTTDEINSQKLNDSKAVVSVKLEVCEGDIGSETSDNSHGMTERLIEDSAVTYQDSVKSSLDDDVSRDLECDKYSNVEHDHVSGDESTEEIFADGNYRGRGNRGGRGGTGHIKNEETMPIGRGFIGERKRGRRPRGRKSIRGGNSSFENKNEEADSPSGLDFGSTEIGGAKLNDSGRGVFVERRKRGRPRGSRGSRGANSSFENKSLDEVCGGVLELGNAEMKGSHLSDTAMSSGGVPPQYETPLTVIKVGRGALRPGCKSYRGRAANMGRGFRMDYDNETPKWEVETGLIPIEYDSALSPLTDVEISGKRQHTSDVLTTPLPKRARGLRGKPRGRSRGRPPRASLNLDRSFDCDSSDFGTPGFESSGFSTTGFESPEVTGIKTEGETEAIDGERSTSKHRRRGRGSRGGKSSSLERYNEDASESAQEEKMVTCSSCKESMGQSMFAYHKLRKHNNCAWREGIDPPLDLNDAKVLNTLLKQALQKRKQLTCEQCGLNRSSLVGFQSHVTFCAKTEGERDALMETCPVCYRRMMPSSLKVHMGVHRQEEKSKKLDKIDNTPEVEMDPGEGSSKSSGKIKRAAANRYALPYYFYDSDGSDTL